MISVTIQEVVNETVVSGGITVEIVAGGFNVDGVNAAWGGIQGDIADQADLQAALGAKAPVSHTHPPSQLTQSGATTGQALIWNGSAWVPGSISPGGSTGQIQYNNGGAFGGTTATFNSGTGITTFAGALVLPSGSSGTPSIGNGDSGIYFDAYTAGSVILQSNSEPVLIASNDTTRALVVPFVSRRAVEARTSATILRGDQHEVITNRGATGMMTHTLNRYYVGPGGRGNDFAFFRVASHAMRIAPTLGPESFRRADGSLTTAGKYLELASDGAMLVILFDGTEWLCLYERGTINVEP